ncbi:MULTISPECIES: class I mannose-6-phosphate isomerase [Fusobacterium]|uniref:class I mannose-6-phosphate isomerase n=1 Tax=Fusobacterium TaxID=848 RepID=UPI001476A1B3|nr:MULTISPECIES: class I mannose-6-phosphate isomerase [Fusobacterium]NME35014.1 mannose-6-phosphate isomerase [Fusobacterium sp. FSA-380-WT-3A]
MYNKLPFIEVIDNSKEFWSGYEDIISKINQKIVSNNCNIVIDWYHGVDESEVINNFINLLPGKKYFVNQFKLSETEILNKIDRFLTDDRVFGYMCPFNLIDFFNKNKIEEFKNSLSEKKEGINIYYGIGASLFVDNPDMTIYLDMARWEIQQRFRDKSLDNWGANNHNEDVLKKYKRSFFIEWRMLDKHKRKLFDKIDFLIDTNIKNQPKMLSGDAFREGLNNATKTPFRVVPFFDPGVWGGQWMKEVCDLDRTKENFAWCFDCVPEENSLLLKGEKDIVIEIPSLDLVLYRPKELLGEQVYARFGAEFPIRFDFLDTMDGQNLSLQVHPVTEYIQEKFGMHYTQDESYYMLDAKEDACVYLGVKKGINPKKFISALEKANTGKEIFDDSKYVNKFPAKKHDHFLIPSGTVHCSGKNSMVLEISSTPYIFTFKLWDWSRVGLDGLPRPIHIEHGKEVIQYNRDTDWVKENLINNIQVLHEEEGIIEERTGLHKLEFIETRRHWFSKPVLHKTNGNVNVLNLVEGEEAIIKSPTNQFKPYKVHYAETFIIPGNVDEYIIEPCGKSLGKTIGTLKAYVRF